VVKRTIFPILLFAIASPGFAKTHNDIFDVSCDALWPAVKDTLRNSGKYGIIGIDNGEMTASYNIGGYLTGKRINSLVLNSKGNATSCEMQVQTSFSGLVNNDEGDFKRRVEASLEKLRATPAEKPAVQGIAAPNSGLAGQPLLKPLTNDDVTTLRAAGFSDDLILAKIKATPGAYNLETADMVRLKNAGLSDTIIAAMVAAPGAHK
jgi:hypothetical protein